MDNRLLLYFILLGIYKISENFIMTKNKTNRYKITKDRSVLLIVIPYYLIIIIPIFEYLHFKPHPGCISMIFGSICFIIATFLRVKAHIDLNKGFSMYIEKMEGQSLVDTGLYRYVRHPLYLGNIFLFLACPILLISKLTWIITIAGIIGILIRIKIEEKFLINNFKGYKEYISKTWALIPKLY